MPVPNNLQPFQLWPIKAKGAIIRHLPAGDPTLEKQYHKALEDGRFLEACIGDAQTWILKEKQRIIEKIGTYLDINSVAVDAQLSKHGRRIKLAIDSIRMLQKVSQFQRDVGSTIQAVTQNIALILTMKNSMLSMVQSNSNALANLLNNICNWGLPKIPSIPNLLVDGLFNWNGYQFSPLQAFAKNIGKLPSFSFNFSFSQCNLLSLGNINNNIYPFSLSTYSGLNYNPQNLFIPPLAGEIVPLGQDTSDLTFITQMQTTTGTPFYNGFNPNSSMLGAVPDPHTIISNYQMPPATYQGNVVSITPALRHNTVEPTDLDYANPDLTARGANLRKDLVHYITLDQVVTSNYDPYITSAWLFYLGFTRTGRAGNWITNFENAYTQHIAPSVTYLQLTPTPWNDLLGSVGTEYMGVWDAGIAYQASDVVVFSGTTYIAIVANTGIEPDADPLTWQTPIAVDTVFQNAPTAIPLITTLKAADSTTLRTTLWKLSYIEASLLGYTRSKTWDAGADTSYLSGFTGSDLDYQPTTFDTVQMTTEILGVGTAAYPTSCTFPTAMKVVFDQVVALATQNIANDTAYQTPHARFKFVYDQFATATLVDRFTQFWRTFNYNLTTLLAQDPYLISRAMSYVGSLDSAIDPLGDPTAYNALSADTANRNRDWVPGTPLLNIPIAPVVAFQNSSSPTAQSNGWIAPPTELDVNAFLSRPDIQAQPISVQISMLRTNLSYAGLQLFASQFSQAIDDQVAAWQAAAAAVQQLGFEVTAVDDTTTVPSGPAGVPVAFDLTNFDITGNVTNPTTFTLQASGEYAGYGQIIFNAGNSGTRTVTVTQNGVPVATVSSDPLAQPTVPPEPLTLYLTFTGDFQQGDVIQVFASHNLSSSQDVLPGSFFSMIQTSASGTAINVGSSNTDGTKDFTTEVSVQPLTVVRVLPDGNVTPIDPFIPTITDVSEDAFNILTITCNDHHFVDGDRVVFSGLQNASYLNNVAVTVLSHVGNQFTATDPTGHVPFSELSVSPPVPETGSVLYANDSGSVLAPNPDGITTDGAPAFGSVPVGVRYGGLFAVTVAQAAAVSGDINGFIVGGLLYVGLNGQVTQDYSTLVAGSPPGNGPVGWIICVGRAISTTEFIYEPHIATRYDSFF
jgi:hypothetical protein